MTREWEKMITVNWMNIILFNREKV